MEFISLYGLFLSKTLTVVLAIDALLLLVFGLRMRLRQRKGQIHIQDLVKQYRERQREMQLARVGEAEKGIWHKRHKSRIKPTPNRPKCVRSGVITWRHVRVCMCWPLPASMDAGEVSSLRE